MTIRINGLSREPQHSIDGYIQEPLSFSPPFTSVTLPDGTKLAQSGVTYVPSLSGWHSFDTDEGTATVLVFNPECVNVVPEVSSGRSAPRTIAERRLVLRNLAAHAGLRGGELSDLSGVSLAAYGA